MKSLANKYVINIPKNCRACTDDKSGTHYICSAKRFDGRPTIPQCYKCHSARSIRALSRIQNIKRKKTKLTSEQIIINKLSGMREKICRQCSMVKLCKRKRLSWCKSDKWSRKPDEKQSVKGCGNWLLKKTKILFAQCPEGKWLEVDKSMAKQFRKNK